MLKTAGSNSNLTVSLEFLKKTVRMHERPLPGMVILRFRIINDRICNSIK